ncbi:MAG TPA: DJ-1/PfpI family protein [Acidimicrobiales bacterium]
MTRTVGIVVFDDVEVLDFAGPFEVFGVTRVEAGEERPFRPILVSEREGPVVARNGFSVNPHATFATCPPLDVVLVPGGGGYHADGTPYGSRREMQNPVMTSWVRERDGESELTLSVCTGALVLGAAGLLDGLRVTTHHQAYDALRRLVPSATVVEGVKAVDAGHVVTSGGISAGIDMSLGIVARLLGPEVATATARQMEYDWTP